MTYHKKGVLRYLRNVRAIANRLSSEATLIADNIGIEVPENIQSYLEVIEDDLNVIINDIDTLNDELKAIEEMEK